MANELMDEWEKSKIQERFELLIESGFPVRGIQEWLNKLSEEEFQTIQKYAKEMIRHDMARRKRIAEAVWLSSEDVEPLWNAVQQEQM